MSKLYLNTLGFVENKLVEDSRDANNSTVMTLLDCVTSTTTGSPSRPLRAKIKNL